MVDINTGDIEFMLRKCDCKFELKEFNSGSIYSLVIPKSEDSVDRNRLIQQICQNTVLHTNALRHKDECLILTFTIRLC